VQASGRSVVIFSNRFPQALQDTAGFLNEIFLRKYGNQAVFLCDDETSLEQSLSSLPDLGRCTCPGEEESRNKRRIFSKRLKYLVGGEDLGTFSVPLAFGNVTVDKKRCTLCLACVGGCRLGALTARSADNSLRFIPSLCTACGSCLRICPEVGCLYLEKGTLALAPPFFQANAIARDELMECTQCGKPFAPKKSIDKIVAIMGPIFAGDPVKMKTLYCCSDCKARIMIERQLSDNMNFK
jgi:ferredoxin